MALPLLLLACRDTRSRFEVWRASQAAETAAYLQFLAAQGVGDVVPADQLLRSGRRWRACKAQEFVVPPRAHWPRIVPVLRLLSLLRKDGLLGRVEIASTYRSAGFNRCEGGSTGSHHMENAAIDLDIDGDALRMARLCEAWRRRGPALRWGLGFYQTGRIHLDTRGFRTWGSDHHTGTSLCIANQKPRR